MQINADRKETEKLAVSTIKRNIYSFKGRIYNASSGVKEQLILSYVRSLLVYVGTPMVVSGIWPLNKIDSIEKQVYRETFLLPHDISSSSIQNTVSSITPASVAVEKLAERIKDEVHKQ